MPQPLGHRVLAEGKGIEPLCGHPQPWLSKPAHYHSGSPPCCPHLGFPWRGQRLSATAIYQMSPSNSPSNSLYHQHVHEGTATCTSSTRRCSSMRRVKESNPQLSHWHGFQDRFPTNRGHPPYSIGVTARIRTGTSAVTVRRSAIELQPPSMRIIPIACFRPTRTAPDSYCPSLEVTDHVSV